MAGPFAINSEEGVGVGLHRIAVGIEVQENLVQLETRVHGQATENSVECNTWAVTHLCECPSAKELLASYSVENMLTHGVLNGPKISVVIK